MVGKEGQVLRIGFDLFRDPPDDIRASRGRLDIGERHVTGERLERVAPICWNGCRRRCGVSRSAAPPIPLAAARPGVPDGLASYGDRVAVRAGPRITKQFDKLSLHFVGDCMLPAPRLGVSLVPLEPDHVYQEPFGEPVLSNNAFRSGKTFGSEVDDPALPRYVTCLGQALQHLGHRRCRAAEPLGDASLYDRGPLFPYTVDRL